MNPVSDNDDDPAHVRIRNVTSSSFEFQIEEWEYQDGIHGAETIAYLVLEAGRHQLSDGTEIEAGKISADSSFSSYSFQQAFSGTPALLAQVQTYNEADACNVHVRNVTSSGFQLLVIEEEAGGGTGSGQSHASETVGYVAIEQAHGQTDGLTYDAKVTPNDITDAWHPITFSQAFPASPVFLATVNTTDGGNTMDTRYRNLSASGVELQCDEEQSADSEVGHTTEAFGYLAVYPAGDIRIGGGTRPSAPYTTGSSDGRMIGVDNGRSGASEEGPGSFPLGGVWTSYVQSAGSPVIDGNRLYVQGNYYGCQLYCLDAETGSKLWIFDAPEWTYERFNSRSLAAADGNVYVTTKNNAGTNYPLGTIYCLDALTGSVKWKKEHPAELNYGVTPPVVADGKVYVSFIGDELYALDENTGSEIWHTTNGASAAAYAGLGYGDGKIFNIVSGYMSAYDVTNGTLLWKVYVNRPWYAESAPVVVSGRVYVARNENSSSAVGVYSTTDGSLLGD